MLLVLALFIPVRWLTYRITEVWGLPEWLDYKPWNCNLCCTFWSLLAIYLTVGIALNLWITMGAGLTLTVLNAIAMWYHQKTHTIKI